MDYWIGRLEFGAGYLDTAKTVRAAASAKNPPDELRQTEAALAKARHALEAYAQVARDRSDYGAIATMGEYVYRPLKDKVSNLKAHLDQRESD